MVLVSTYANNSTFCFKFQIYIYLWDRLNAQAFILLLYVLILQYYYWAPFYCLGNTIKIKSGVTLL